MPVGWNEDGREKYREMGAVSLKCSRHNDPCDIHRIRVYTMTTGIRAEKISRRLGFRLINFLITNSSKWVGEQRQRTTTARIDQSRIFDVIDGRRGGPQERAPSIRSWLLLILQVLLVIVYIYSVLSGWSTPPLHPVNPLVPHHRPYLPPRRRIEAKLRIGWDDAAERDGCIYKLTKQRYAILKCTGKLKVEAAWNRLIKNYFVAAAVWPARLNVAEYRNFRWPSGEKTNKERNDPRKDLLNIFY